MPEYTPLSASDVQYIVVHCSATRRHADIGVEDIRRWHVEDRGWLDVGYHYVIRRDGTVEPGRPLTAMGAHVRGYNDRSIGICLVGGLDQNGNPKDNFTPEQLNSLERLVLHLKDVFPDAEELVGHRDLDPSKACPCFDLSDEFDTTL